METRAAALQQVGARSVKEYRLVPGLYLVRLWHPTPVAAANAARAQPGVLYADLNFRRLPASDPCFPAQWGLHVSHDGPIPATPCQPAPPPIAPPRIRGADVRAIDAWTVTFGEPFIVIAIIDGGFGCQHPDLIANLWVNQAELNGTPGVDDDGNGWKDDVYGLDVGNADGNPCFSPQCQSPQEHGTLVAGVAAARLDGAGIVGIAPFCRWMAINISPQDGFYCRPDSGTLDSFLIEALEYASFNGAKVINISMAGPGYSQAYSDAIKATGELDCLVVCAAGNNSLDLDQTPRYPASYGHDNMIVVAATMPDDKLAYFSNFGASTVHLAAPGGWILSTTALQGSPAEYEYTGGTSFASPLVAGIAALVWSHNPLWTYAQVRQAIQNGVRAHTELDGKTAWGGVADAARALGLP